RSSILRPPPRAGRPAGREERGPRGDRTAVSRDANTARVGRPERVRLFALEDRDPGVVDDALGECVRDLAPGRRAARMHDARPRVSSFEAEARIDINSP